jgi:hypothetical protein
MYGYMTDTDEFQQIQSIGSMEEVQNCLKMAMLSVSVWACLVQQFITDFGMFGM